MIKSKKERAKFIQKRLQELYPHPPIPLTHKDAYTLLIAVLLSAQCRDDRVNQVTPELFRLADNPQDMVQLKVSQIAEVIKPCGLSPRKSKAIWQLSGILLDKYEGRVPDSFEQLEELPGVGHKTASVVMIQAFDKIAFPVDTHIHRLASRWRLSEARNVEQTERDLKKIFDKSKWKDLHLQIIYYGREHCSARGCDGSICQICQAVN